MWCVTLPCKMKGINYLTYYKWPTNSFLSEWHFQILKSIHERLWKWESLKIGKPTFHFGWEGTFCIVVYCCILPHSCSGQHWTLIEGLSIETEKNDRVLKGSAGWLQLFNLRQQHTYLFFIFLSFGLLLVSDVSSEK